MGSRGFSHGVTAICVIAALLVLVGSIGVSPSLLGLRWLKSYPSLWHWMFVVNWFAFCVAAAYAVFRGALSFYERNKALFAFSAESYKYVAMTAILVVAVFWPTFATIHLRDDAVIKRYSEERAAVCSAAMLYVGGGTEEAHNYLNNFNAYYYEDFEGYQNRAARLNPAVIEAARLATQLTREERLQRRHRLSQDIREWARRCHWG